MTLSACMRSAGLADAVKPGLKALGRNSQRIRVAKPAAVTDSIDLDAVLTAANAPGAKWDYGIGIARGQAHEVAWVEVHTASSGEVEAVLAKLRALQQWLQAQPDACRAVPRSFHWVATEAGVHIDAARRRRLNAAGLRMPQALLRL